MTGANSTAIFGARIFDGEIWHDGKTLLVADGRFAAIADNAGIAQDIPRIDASGLRIVPGFIDLQVNGGGGVLLNEQPDVDGIRRICAAHAAFGTTALLPTLITDTPAITLRALDAGRVAQAEGVPGFLGLHMEGPHLSVARKGAHDPQLIRVMGEDDLARLAEARASVPTLMATVAPENVSTNQVRRLVAEGIVVSLGHSDTDCETAKRYADAGASVVTHLFNAMSPLTHREPGMVGAALTSPHLSAGLIADGFHVDPAAISIALKAKAAPGRIFLVTDAMSTIGTDILEFTLNGRKILRQGGRLTLADGTLAGADIDMLSSVRFLVERVHVPLEEALRMASLYPAEVAGFGDRKGKIAAGFDADFLILDPDHLSIRQTWIGGRLHVANDSAATDTTGG
jgi:N-acetylglucosamine-6-phosphate deacetylase